MAGVIGGIFDLLVWTDPVQDFALLTPETVRIAHGLAIQGLIIRTGNQCGAGELGNNRMDLDLTHNALLGNIHILRVNKM